MKTLRTINLRKDNNSVTPPALLEPVVESWRERRYTLSELLAQCAPKARRTKEEREWLNSKPAGAEIV